jgi:hypothetical protein
MQQKAAQVRIKPVLAVEFEAAQALDFEMSPQSLSRGCALGTKPVASFTRTFIISIYKRVPEKAR